MSRYEDRFSIINQVGEVDSFSPEGNTFNDEVSNDDYFLGDDFAVSERFNGAVKAAEEINNQIQDEFAQPIVEVSVTASPLSLKDIEGSGKGASVDLSKNLTPQALAVMNKMSAPLFNTYAIKGLEKQVLARQQDKLQVEPQKMMPEKRDLIIKSSLGALLFYYILK